MEGGIVGFEEQETGVSKLGQFISALASLGEVF